jgi:hypothetical protein
LASQGLPVDYRAGQGCPAEDFRRALDEGYREGLARRCSVTDSEALGFQAGGTSGAEEFPQIRFKACQDIAGLHQVFHAGFARGRGNLCSAEKAQEAGSQDGGAGRAPSPPPEWERVCPASLQDPLRLGYLSAYHRALADFCEGGPLIQIAEGDGARGVGSADLDSWLARCPAGERARLGAIYQQSYRRGLVRYCDEETLAREADFQARKASEGTLPAAWLVCQPYFPDLPARFQKLFQTARAKWVAQECTFRGGARRGAEDAGESNEPSTDTPAFCDDRHYTGFVAGYLEGWQSGKEAICDRDASYQQGVRDGDTDKPQAFEPPELCPSAYRSSLNEAYRAGYDMARFRAEWRNETRSDAGEKTPICRAAE